MMRRALAVIGLVAAAGVSAEAQVSCLAIGASTCDVPGFTISITVTQASRLVISGPTVTMPNPTDVELVAGFGLPGSLAYQVRANSPWTLTVRGASATWTGTPASARQNKPVSDLQWATAPGGPFTDMTQVAANFASGTATAGSYQSLFLRPKLGFALDLAGSYSIELLLTITSP